MHAGVAAADITPPLGLVLQGHYGGKPSHAVLHPIEARAVALRTDDAAVAIVTLDVIGATRQTTQAIRDEVARRTKTTPHVMVCASHTHSAPATLPNLGLKPDDTFMRTLIDRAAGCAVEALEKTEPVTIGFGCGSAHFNVNRRPLPGTTAMFPNVAGIVDRRVRVLRVDRADGSPLAVLFHYSCHPTAKRGADGLISSDYPGVARAHVESELGCRALFLPGCFGNVRPHLLNKSGGFASATPEQLDQLGRALARTVCSTARATMTGQTDALSARETDVTLPFAPMRTRAELQSLTTDGPDDLVRAWAQRMLAHTGDHPREERSIMQSVHVGPLALVSIPGEPVQEIGHDVERRLSDAALETWPIGYTNDMLGYLVTERMKREGGYEPTAYPYFDRHAPFDNEETILADAAERLVRGGGAMNPLVDVERFEIFATGLDHPECCAFDRDGNLWAGGEAGQVYRIDPGGKVEQVANLGSFNAGLAFSPDDELFVCNPAQGVIRVHRNGRHEPFGDKRPTAVNFPVFDSKGYLFVSDSGVFRTRDGAGSVYRFAPDGAAEEIAGPFEYANGLALSADEQYLFVVASASQAIYRLDLGFGKYLPHAEHRVFAEHVGRFPDGIALDASGNLYAACYASDDIHRITPAGETQLFAHDPWAIKLCRPTNLTFRDGWMYVANLGRQTITRAKVNVEGQPLANQKAKR